MCSKETIDNALEGINITKHAIIFLENKNEIDKMFIFVKNKIFNKDDFYITELEEKIDLFESSIIGTKGHIQYIIKKLTQRKTASFQEYNENANELKKLKKAYCFFYTEFESYIQTVDKTIIKHNNIKEVLIESFKAFAKTYCPQPPKSSSKV